MSERRPFGRLLLVALAIVAQWTVLALFQTSEFLRYTMVTSVDHAWTPVFCYQLSTTLLWAVFTPVIVFFVERMPLRGPSALHMFLGLLVVAAGIAALRALIGGVVHDVFGLGKLPTLSFLLLSLEIRFHRNFFFTVVIMAIAQVMVEQRHLAQQSASAAALEGELAAAELESLRARLQPRFILGALEAIGTRIGRRAEGADALIAEFGELLRAMLGKPPERESTIREELERIAPYLAFERARTDGAFNSRIVLPSDLLDARIPSLLLHPLVQDALTRRFEHGEGRLEIRGRRDGLALRFELDEGVAQRHPERPILEEVRARLRGVFGDEASVETIETEHHRVVTTLRMPLRMTAEGCRA